MVQLVFLSTYLGVIGLKALLTSPDFTTKTNEPSNIHGGYTGLYRGI